MSLVSYPALSLLLAMADAGDSDGGGSSSLDWRVHLGKDDLTNDVGVGSDIRPRTFLRVYYFINNPVVVVCAYNYILLVGIMSE